MAGCSPPRTSRRIRIEWEGAEYRGRFRQVAWDGSAAVTDNRIVDLRPVNFFNPDKRLERVGDTKAQWQSLTTGNVAGVDLWLSDADRGKLAIDTPLVKADLNIAAIGVEATTFDQSGDLPRWLRVSRLPETMDVRETTFAMPVQVSDAGDNPIYLRLVQEDGTRAWTSPIYVYR